MRLLPHVYCRKAPQTWATIERMFHGVPRDSRMMNRAIDVLDHPSMEGFGAVIWAYVAHELWFSTSRREVISVPPHLRRQLASMKLTPEVFDAAVPPGPPTAAMAAQLLLARDSGVTTIRYVGFERADVISERTTARPEGCFVWRVWAENPAERIWRFVLWAPNCPPWHLAQMRGAPEPDQPFFFRLDILESDMLNGEMGGFAGATMRYYDRTSKRADPNLTEGLLGYFRAAIHALAYTNSHNPRFELADAHALIEKLKGRTRTTVVTGKIPKKTRKRAIAEHIVRIKQIAPEWEAAIRDAQDTTSVPTGKRRPTWVRGHTRRYWVKAGYGPTPERPNAPRYEDLPAHSEREDGARPVMHYVMAFPRGGTPTTPKPKDDVPRLQRTRLGPE